ncbi:sigma 54-interacting response regulator [Mucilaginibacter sp. UR6-1]|uniref:sigma 54-interacting response regulator n=1 Tax=Mucilaginibacter sp. UR6-1 TaxID=1435643 RepID=UPI00272AB5F6|nr:sigma 54-interacting response regulator [Mucilaginibacter sp. UR6-1]
MSKNILIVEDEFVVANGLRLTLEKAGYSVNGIATSADDADRMLHAQAADLVLLDIGLNGKQTGIDLARKLRADNIAFIYLSANSGQKVLEQAKATEPYGFLVKPYREKDLLIMLDIAWYRHRHSLESRLRNEELLQKQLREIAKDRLDAQLKLSLIARALQAHIPFDLFIFGQRPVRQSLIMDTVYLRTGFDEYQLVGEQGISNNKGQQHSLLSRIIGNDITDADEPVFRHDLIGSDTDAGSVEKELFDRFKVQSYLVFPLSSDGSSTAYCYFYSRQPQIYNPGHIDLLNRLKPCITKVIADITDQQTRQNSPLMPDSEQQLNNAHTGFSGIIGRHPLLLAALDMALQVAPYNTSVLILGESGTGKERVAQAIHNISPRKSGPFIKVNCAAIPGALVESELFGHEKGAFTGAVEKRPGRFEQADGGTIFLDEIGELPLEIQVKLLRVLQEKEIDTIGGKSSKKVDVRVVAATSRNLEKEVAAGNFRLDLYYRLNVFPITLPPLCDRQSDIPALACFFADKFCREFNKKFTGVAQSMLDEMLSYNWPGNIRELENVVERSVILHEEGTELELKRSLPVAAANVAVTAGLGTFDDVKQVQRETERVYIISILKKAGGRIRGANGAAELLNIKPTTLESKMAKLGIKKEDIPGAGNA